MSSDLILISARPEDEVFAKKVAENANLSFHQIADSRTAVEEIHRIKPKAIFIDGNSDERVYFLTKEFKHHFGVMSDIVDPNCIHFIASAELSDCKYLTQCEYFGNFIRRSFYNPEEANHCGHRYGKLLAYQLDDSKSGLSTILNPKAQIQSITMKSSKEKLAIVDAIKTYASKANFGSRPTTLIANCADELIMNALFNAPVDPMGKKVFDSTPRDVDFALNERHQVEVSVGYDGKVLAISVRDHFGSVDKEKIIFHISSVYAHNEYKVKMIAGAGLGLSNIFQTGGSLFFNVQRGEKTEVIALFERCENYRAFKEQFRFFSTSFTY